MAEITPLHSLLTLPGALSTYAMVREVAEDLASSIDALAQGYDDPEYFWPKSFLPVLKSGNTEVIAIDLTHQGASSRLFLMDAVDDDRRRVEWAPSVGALLARVCSLYETDTYVWHSEPIGHWVYHGPGEDPLSSIGGGGWA